MKAFKSRRKAFFVLAALCSLCLYSLKDLRLTCVPPAAFESYAVEFDWFGMDAEKIERAIAIPLEEKIGGLENLVCVSSVCEWSKCKTSAVFLKAKRPAFFALSAAASELSRALPQDAQKPRIYAAESEAKRLFCAAFDAKKHSREELERRLKGPLQSVQGVSQAVFTGGGTEEIQLAFNAARLWRLDMAPWDLSQALREQNAGALFGENLAFQVRAQTAQEINAIPKIASAAKAQTGFQRRESIVRVNGKECVLASVQSASESQNIRIARAARRILKKEFPQKGEYQIVFDNGREQEKALLGMALAFLQGLLALAGATLFFYRSIKKTAAVMLWTGIGLLFSLAALAVLKIPLDSAAISGLTISLGLLCDAALYLSDDCEPSVSAMAIASLTSVCAILPLCALDPIAPGMKGLAIACSIAIALSAFLAPVFLPLFFGNKTPRVEWQKTRNFLNLSPFSYIKPRNLLRLSTFLYILTPFIFVFSPKNLARTDDSLCVYAQAEYPPERRAEFIDKDISRLLKEAQKIKGTDFVQSEARRGSAEITLVAKSARQKERAAKELLALSHLIGGSLYVPLSPPKRKVVQCVRAAVLGDDSGLCRRLAKEAADSLWASGFFSKNKGQVVLNFKDDERVLTARPNKNFLAKNGLSVQEAAQSLRWSLFGAVVQKVRLGEKRLDVRAGQKDAAFGGGFKESRLFSLRAKGLPIMAAFSIQSQKRPSKIFRKDGRRAAWLSVEVESDKSDKVFRELKRALYGVNLPQGYWFDFPREYENLEQNYGRAFAAFLFALLAVYVLIAAQCERPLDALKALLTIPLSLFLPLFLRAAALCPLTLGDAAGMVFVSGLCVNNAIYIMSEWNSRGRKDAREAARAVLKSVLSSSATTIAGALPVLFFGAGGFSKDLAFFTLFGTLGSLAASLIFFPEMLKAKEKAARRKKNLPLTLRLPILRKAKWEYKRRFPYSLSRE